MLLTHTEWKSSCFTKASRALNTISTLSMYLWSLQLLVWSLPSDQSDWEHGQNDAVALNEFYLLVKRLDMAVFVLQAADRCPRSRISATFTESVWILQYNVKIYIFKQLQIKSLLKLHNKEGPGLKIQAFVTEGKMLLKIVLLSKRNHIFLCLYSDSLSLRMSSSVCTCVCEIFLHESSLVS